MLTTATIGLAYPMPVCTYSVRRGSYDGPPIGYLRVGDPVFHRWECKGAPGHDGKGLFSNCVIIQRSFHILRKHI